MLTLMQLVAENAPPKGKGCYQIPATLLVHKEFINELIAHGENAQVKI
jgi:hypothetical protein